MGASPEHLLVLTRVAQDLHFCRSSKSNGKKSLQNKAKCNIHYEYGEIELVIIFNKALTLQSTLKEPVKGKGKVGRRPQAKEY